MLACCAFLLAASTGFEAARVSQVEMRSIPDGAAISLRRSGRNYRTGKTTPTVLTLPFGEVEIVFHKRPFEPLVRKIEIKEETRQIPCVILEPAGARARIIFELGWLVLLDDEYPWVPAGCFPYTPCTINVPLGRHKLTLVKPGFQDINRAIQSKSRRPLGDIRLKAKAVRGDSIALAERFWLTAVGAWRQLDNGRRFKLYPHGMLWTDRLLIQELPTWRTHMKTHCIRLVLPSGSDLDLMSKNTPTDTMDTYDARQRTHMLVRDLQAQAEAKVEPEPKVKSRSR